MANFGSNLVVLEICRMIFSYVSGEKSGLVFKNILLVTELATQRILRLFVFMFVWIWENFASLEESLLTLKIWVLILQYVYSNLGQMKIKEGKMRQYTIVVLDGGKGQKHTAF